MPSDEVDQPKAICIGFVFILQPSSLYIPAEWFQSRLALGIGVDGVDVLPKAS